jgi:hypothetical protein
MRESAMNVPLTLGISACVAALALFVVGLLLVISGAGASIPIGVIVLIVAGLLEPVGVLLVLRGLQDRAGTNGRRTTRPTDAPVLYADRVLQLYGDGLYFPVYYFPWGGRFVPFADVERIECLRPTLLSGKWRLWGTSNLKMWFPLDARRNTREVIFHLYHKGRRGGIGFTAENSHRVRELLGQRVQLVDRSTQA